MISQEKDGGGADQSSEGLGGVGGSWLHLEGRDSRIC